MRTYLVLSLFAFAITLASNSSVKLGRLTGGEPAVTAAAPFIVVLSNGTIFCAGSIIHPNWVLTAAHCILYDTFDIIAGVNRVRPQMDSWLTQTRTVTNETHVVIHDLYNNDDFDSCDVALVHIDEPFDITKNIYVRSIKIPQHVYDTFPDDEILFYGWGYVENGQLPDDLQVLVTDIISYDMCRKMIDADIPLMDFHMCTEGPQGFCLLDSGGPLVRDYPDGPELIGIASYGESPCDIRNGPSVYVRVDKITDWINRTISNYKTKQQDTFDIIIKARHKHKVLKIKPKTFDFNQSYS